MTDQEIEYSPTGTFRTNFDLRVKALAKTQVSRAYHWDDGEIHYDRNYADGSSEEDTQKIGEINVRELTEEDFYEITIEDEEILNGEGNTRMRNFLEKVGLVEDGEEIYWDAGETPQIWKDVSGYKEPTFETYGGGRAKYPSPSEGSPLLED